MAVFPSPDPDPDPKAPRLDYSPAEYGFLPSAPPGRNSTKAAPARAPPWMPPLIPSGMEMRPTRKKKDLHDLFANMMQKDVYALLTNSTLLGIDVDFQAKQRDLCVLFGSALLQVGVVAHPAA